MIESEECIDELASMNNPLINKHARVVSYTGEKMDCNIYIV